MARKQPGEELVVMVIVGAALVIGHKQGLFNLKELWDSIFGGGTTTPPPPGTTPPPGGGGGGGGAVPPGTVLYDSANGWTDIETAASGNPQFDVDADGTGHLSVSESDAHGRIYINVKNYNSVMQGEWMFEDNNVLSFTQRLRSRHGEADPCENRFGGFGSSIHLEDDSIGFQTEICHNEHENSLETQSPEPFEVGKWYGFRYYCVDSADKSSVNFKMEIDYGSGFQTVHTGSHTSPQAHYLDEASFEENSYAWLRLNNSGAPSSLAFRNFKMIAQEPGSLDGETSSRVRSYPARKHMNNYYLYNSAPAGLY